LTDSALEYTDGEVVLTGYLSGGGGVNRAPGLLIFHGGAGLDGHAREQSDRYAARGYIALAADLFGPGAMASRETVMATIVALRSERELLSRRASAALTALRRQPTCSGRVGVVGFCFGGLAALEFARAGAEVDAVVSIHGSLATERPATPGTIRARVLACHGAADPHVPLAQTTAFAEEMEAAGADWEMVIYGQAKHGFTHRHAAGSASSPGVEYDERADTRSFARAIDFLGKGAPDVDDRGNLNG